jgi:hypothetical protein
MTIKAGRHEVVINGSAGLPADLDEVGLSLFSIYKYPAGLPSIFEISCPWFVIMWRYGN